MKMIVLRLSGMVLEFFDYLSDVVQKVDFLNSHY